GMSYTNCAASYAPRRAPCDHARPCVAVINLAKPCGIAIATAGGPSAIAEAHRQAHASDPVSAFGGVIAANREVTVEMAEQVAEIFTEVIIAPSYADGAVDVLTRKKNIRVLVAPEPAAAGLELKPIGGGLLVQEIGR